MSSRPRRVQAGSPPRGWGKLVEVIGIIAPERFTPTRVGKTPKPSVVDQARAVHPHAGGENLTKCLAKLAQTGSPPRGWGKQAERRRELDDRRFTPTRVGKTGGGGRAAGVRAVHPHAGGENKPASDDTEPRCGSPPRGWGKLRKRRHNHS